MHDPFQHINWLAVIVAAAVLNLIIATSLALFIGGGDWQGTILGAWH